MRSFVVSHISIYLAIVIYCGWLSFDLISAWQNDPFVRSGSWAFILWLFLLAIVFILQRGSSASSSSLQIAAIFLGTLGLLGQLNALQHLGLACALCSLPINQKSRLLLLCSSIFWMPLLGWFGHRSFLVNPDFARLPLILITAILLSPFIRLQKTKP